MYAVKANRWPELWRELWAGGITNYDVASIAEVRLVRQTLGDAATLCFMHPVKAEEAIAEAYLDHGVRTFSLDSREELDKIVRATNGATDRSEERSVGKECVSTCRSRWSPSHYKTTQDRTHCKSKLPQCTIHNIRTDTS